MSTPGPSSSGSARGELPPLPEDDESPPPAPPPPPSTLPVSDAQLAGFLARPADAVTADLYETALLRLASCKPGFFSGVDPSCPAAKDYSKLRARLKIGDGVTGPVALRHLRHPSVNVRLEAVWKASSHAFDPENPNEANERLYLDAMRAESDPKVLRALLFHCGRGAARNGAILRVVLRSLEHADEGVRGSALGIVAKPDVARQVPGAFERLALGTKSDRPRIERMNSCEHVGKLGDPRAVPVLAALLDDAALPDDIRGACFEGLVGTWSSHEGQLGPSKDGYELTMKILNAKPRSRATPHERGVLALALAGRDRTLPDGSKWSDQVRSFYDVRAVSDALASIVLDEQAGELARTSAGFSLVKLEQLPAIEATVRSLEARGGALSQRFAKEIRAEVARDRELHGRLK